MKNSKKYIIIGYYPRYKSYFEAVIEAAFPFEAIMKLKRELQPRKQWKIDDIQIWNHKEELHKNNGYGSWTWSGYPINSGYNEEERIPDYLAFNNEGFTS